MNSNIIPKAQPDVVNLALRALAGLQARGASAGVLQNTAERLGAEIYALIGDPSTPGIPGKQALLDAQLRAMKSTQAALDAVLKTARDFCHTGIGTLKPVFGHRWNGAWLAAGFTAQKLAVPMAPLALLAEFRVFLTANPARQSESLGFTAAAAQAHIEAIQQATLARNDARGARWSVKAARDAAFRQIRKRLSGLRAELAQLLAPADDRWNAFCFRRPADGKQPAPVEEVKLTPIGPAAVKVTWPAASKAKSYRVRWRIAGTEEEWREAALVAGTEHALTDLPTATIEVSVSARNDSGESAAASARETSPRQHEA